MNKQMKYIFSEKGLFDPFLMGGWTGLLIALIFHARWSWLISWPIVWLCVLMVKAYWLEEKVKTNG